VYPGTLDASMWYIAVFDPGLLSFFVMNPWCCLCDLFFPLFFEHERHFGILQHVATCLFALISQFLICCCIYVMAACAYVSWRRKSSCWDVFRFEAYAAGVIVWSGLRKMTRLRPLLLGCCAKVEDA
jgi:hypothetical protein